MTDGPQGTAMIGERCERLQEQATAIGDRLQLIHSKLFGDRPEEGAEAQKQGSRGILTALDCLVTDLSQVRQLAEEIDAML